MQYRTMSRKIINNKNFITIPNLEIKSVYI